MADYILTNPKAPWEEREETEQQKSERQEQIEKARKEALYGKEQPVQPTAVQQPASQQQPARLSHQQQELDNLQKWYNDYVDKNGFEPSDEILTQNTQYKGYVLRPAIKAKYGKDTRVNAGGMFSLANDAVRKYFNEGYAEHQKDKDAQALAARAFSQRKDGAIQVPEGTPIYGNEGGVRYTQQDLNALKAWVREPKSPERDAAIVGALSAMGISLPNNGTLEQRLSEYVKNPKAFESENLTDAQIADKANTLAALLDYAGATMDDEGTYVMPEKYTQAQLLQKRLDDFVNQKQAEKEKQEALLERRRARMGLADLAAVFGDVIKGSTGAKVFPRDLSKAYDALDERQQKLYDAYIARTEAQRQRLEAERRDLEKQAHDDAEAGKARKLRKQLADDANDARIKAAQYRSYRYNNSNRDVKYGIYFGTDLVPENDGFKEWKTTADGNRVYAQIYNYLFENGLIPADEFRYDNNGDPYPHSMTDRIKLVNTYVYDAMVNPLHKRKIVKIALGKDFRDPLTASIEDNAKKPTNAVAQSSWVQQAMEQNQRLPYDPNQQTIPTVIDWDSQFEKND